MPLSSRSGDSGDRRDLYEVLSIHRSASPEQIKAAYRKAALRLHPDKNSGVNSEQAARAFQFWKARAQVGTLVQEVSAAYNILSDPQKRQKYDLQGFSGVEAAEVDLQVDVTSLNLFSTVAASLFTNLGVTVRTALPAAIQNTAASGDFRAQDLGLGQTIEGRVDKAQAVFYNLAVSRQEVEEGFIIGAYSAAGHRIKLLLFEPVGSKSWELQEQEDSVPTQNGTSLAGIFLSHDKTYCIRPSKVGPEAKMNLESQLFQKLDTMTPREHIRVQAGNILVAVYNDNWFKKANYKIAALSPKAKDSSREALMDVQQQEARLLEMQSTIHKFQIDYTKAQEEWLRASQRFQALKSDMNEILAQRDDAYLKLMGVSQASVSSLAPKQNFLSGWGGHK